MSQTASILSCCVSHFSDPYDWSLLVGYLSDANLPMTAQVFIGPDPAPFGALSYPMWTSATATISATLPGTASAVLIVCPPLIQWAAFGVKTSGLPFV
ncbi:MAG TPA: hypothetical protein VEU98_04515 [Candidatus Eremiobacteraceae bacterium]|nr:hypothetical protein [Candidatus Eremiobacteraceae bacterium]